jgi:hypothetical protein
MLTTWSGSGTGDGMRILFVANTSFFLHNFMLGTMRRVREEGCEVVAAAPVDGLTPRVEAEGFRVHPLRELDRKGSNPFQDLRLLRELYGLYRREKPDLVLHFTIKVNVYGSIAAKLAKTKSVCTVTGLGWLFTEKGVVTAIGGMLYKILYRIAFVFTEKVIFQNHDDRDFFLRRKLVSNDKALVTPGVGIDTSHFIIAPLSKAESRFPGCDHLIGVFDDDTYLANVSQIDDFCFRHIIQPPLIPNEFRDKL